MDHRERVGEMGGDLRGAVPVICHPCKMDFHDSCDNTQPSHGGGNWCDCQHEDRVWPEEEEH